MSFMARNCRALAWPNVRFGAGSMRVVAEVALCRPDRHGALELAKGEMNRAWCRVMIFDVHKMSNTGERRKHLPLSWTGWTTLDGGTPQSNG